MGTTTPNLATPQLDPIEGSQHPWIPENETSPLLQPSQGDDIMKSELQYDISFDVSSNSDFDLNHAAAKGSDPSEKLEEGKFQTNTTIWHPEEDRA